MTVDGRGPRMPGHLSALAVAFVRGLEINTGLMQFNGRGPQRARCLHEWEYLVKSARVGMEMPRTKCAPPRIASMWN
eukprot:8668837-Pyramimonas_sp.AAC.1